jgi:hypothetical protein
MTKERLEAFNKYGGFYKLPDIKSDNPLKHLEEFKKANKNGMGFK